MSDNVPNLRELIGNARVDQEALGLLLEEYRSYLLIVSRRQINPKVAVRCGPSDIVQETLAEALAGFKEFRGEDEAQFTAWIGRIHQHRMDDAARKHLIAKRRSADREQRVGDANGTATISWRDAAAREPTPSERAILGERALQLAKLLATLPEAQCEAVCMRHLDGMPIAEIAEQMRRSMQSVAGLLKRGLKSLRKGMTDVSWI